MIDNETINAKYSERYNALAILSRLLGGQWFGPLISNVFAHSGSIWARMLAWEPSHWDPLMIRLRSGPRDPNFDWLVDGFGDELAMKLAPEAATSIEAWLGECTANFDLFSVPPWVPSRCRSCVALIGGIWTYEGEPVGIFREDSLEMTRFITMRDILTLVSLPPKCFAATASIRDTGINNLQATNAP